MFFTFLELFILRNVQGAFECDCFIVVGDGMLYNKSKAELAEEIAANLPKLRELYNISQTRLGELLGKSRQQISKIERGVAPISWDTCLAIVMLACKKDKKIFISVMGEDFIEELHSQMISLLE